MLNKRFTLNEIQLVYILIVKVKMVDIKDKLIQIITDIYIS